MIIQYPHIAQIYGGADTYQDNTGNWVPSSLSIQFETKCRVEPAKNNQYTVGADGNRIYFSSVIYMPLPRKVVSNPSPTPTPGTEIIYQGESIPYKVPNEANGLNQAIIPGLNGRKFNLKLEGRLMEPDVEYVAGPNGFTLMDSTLVPGQRFELAVYYVFTVKDSNNLGVSVGSDFTILPGTLFEVWNGNIRLVRDTVKQFSAGQLNMRIWV